MIGWSVLGESLSLMQLAGAGIIVAGVYLAQRKP
jgi:drug/metabolite transporter (DMT)-like permease